MSTNEKKLESLEATLAANPASKIFLPLAEQYRLQGNLERAAALLQAGLKHNPGYSVAGVALGRVHLERGELSEGRRLLTKLLLEVPDNLLAHKLLDDAGGPLQETPAVAEHGPADGPEHADLEPQKAAGGSLPPAHEGPVPNSVDGIAGAEQAPDGPEEDDLQDYGVPEAEELGFHVALDEDLHAEEAAPQVPMDKAGLDLEEATALSESAWTDPHADPEEPPSPEPGVWKEDDEAITRTWDDRPGEVNSAPPPESMAEPPAEPDAAPQPFETVRLQRSGLLPAFFASRECQAEADEAEDAVNLAVHEDAPSDVHPEMESVAALTTVEKLPAVPSMTAAPVVTANESPASHEFEKSEPLVEGMPLVTSPPAEDGEIGHVAVSHADPAARRTAVSLADEEAADRTLSLARLYRRQGRLDLSADVYRDILDNDPEHPAARRELEELCGRNVPEITDEDLVPEAAGFPEGVQLASAESMEDARRRKITFLRAWLEHIRHQD